MCPGCPDNVLEKFVKKQVTIGALDSVQVNYPYSDKPGQGVFRPQNKYQ